MSTPLSDLTQLWANYVWSFTEKTMSVRMVGNFEDWLGGMSDFSTLLRNCWVVVCVVGRTIWVGWHRPKMQTVSMTDSSKEHKGKRAEVMKSLAWQVFEPFEIICLVLIANVQVTKDFHWNCDLIWNEKQAQWTHLYTADWLKYLSGNNESTNLAARKIINEFLTPL